MLYSLVPPTQTCPCRVRDSKPLQFSQCCAPPLLGESLAPTVQALMDAHPGVRFFVPLGLQHWFKQEVRGAVMIPVHWGLFELAPHSWTEPAERVLAAAKAAGVVVNIPKPGESIEPKPQTTVEKWWPQTQWKMASLSPIVATKNGNPIERFDDAVWDTK